VWLVLCLLIALPARAFFMSADKEAEIGRELYEKITSQMAVYEEPELNAYLERVGDRLVAQTERADEDFTFTIIDSPDINAFATPGGYVYVNRGLIGYLQSEAQLAAVVAHEIAHVTARHAARQKRARTTSNIAAGLLAILSRSGEVGEATALWGEATVRGYGRDMELEADGLGAKFLARAGYRPQAMIDVITLLKDNERFEKRRASESGRETQTYHGLFATHPRNDQRLREVVSSAGDILEAEGETNATAFRIATDGLVWGENFQAKPRKKNRYYHEGLRFRFDYPENWQFTESEGTIVGQRADGSGELHLAIHTRTLAPPAQFIKDSLGIPFIRKSQPFSQGHLQGHTGLIPGKDGAPDKRLAVIYYNRHAYVFTGEVRDTGNREVLDDEFLQIIGSFAPLSRAQLSNREPERIHYVKATDNTTFAQLARYLKLGRYGEEQLRLINGYYPVGEPEAGEWIKIIR
jgi:predicted Zn-dependent protease